MAVVELKARFDERGPISTGLERWSQSGTQGGLWRGGLKTHAKMLLPLRDARGGQLRRLLDTCPTGQLQPCAQPWESCIPRSLS